MLAEHLDEQPAETRLTDLVACYTEGAADAVQIPWNGWIRDGLETVALFGLANRGRRKPRRADRPRARPEPATRPARPTGLAPPSDAPPRGPNRLGRPRTGTTREYSSIC